MMDKRKAYEEKLDAQLQEWSTQIALLRALADKTTADMKIDCYKTIDTLQRMQDMGRRKLHESQAAGDEEAWEDLKTRVQKAWVEVKTACHGATSRFKSLRQLNASIKRNVIE